MASYYKYKNYYDKKANSTPLKLQQHCLILDPEVHNRNCHSEQTTNEMDTSVQITKSYHKPQLHCHKIQHKLHPMRASDETQTD